MTDRNRQELGSKFWGKGKWDNFVAPFLPSDCSDLSFIDIGCNAGIFLEEAEKHGFSEVMGIDSNKKAYLRAEAYKKRVNGKYKIHHNNLERAWPYLPTSDYIVFANLHYYIDVERWINYIDEAIGKMRYVVVVTTKKRKEKLEKAGSYPKEVRKYFQLWEEVGCISNIPLEGDPCPREVWGLCFKSPYLERVILNELSSDSKVKDGFYEELNRGIDYNDTDYYRWMRKYRKSSRHWSDDSVKKYISKKAKLYESIKKNGILQPLIVTSEGKIRDGNHRYAILKHLGYKSAIVRKI